MAFALLLQPTDVKASGLRIGRRRNAKQQKIVAMLPKVPPIRQVGIVYWPYKTLQYLVEKSSGDSEVKTDSIIPVVVEKKGEDRGELDRAEDVIRSHSPLVTADVTRAKRRGSSCTRHVFLAARRPPLCH